MTEVRIVTAPDILYGFTTKVLMIHPSDTDFSDLQSILMKSNESVDVYVYDGDDVDWLMQAFHLCDWVFINLDNSKNEAHQLSGYFIGHNKTFWLTTQSNTVYNYISKHRVYDLSFLKILEAPSEEQQ